jgi:rubrerythrin
MPQVELPPEPEEEPIQPPEARHFATELIWRCSDCGAVVAAREEGPPDACPDCGAPKEALYLVTED